MRKCAACGLELASFLGVSFPHVCRPAPVIIERASPVAEADVDRTTQLWGTSQGWAPTVYGEYYAKSPLIYSAVKLIADAVAMVPLKVLQVKGDEREDVAPDHPLAELMRRVNPHWTRADLWRGTVTQLSLWGSCYWLLDKSGERGAPKEIWLGRPDRMRIIPSQDKWIAGYEYRGVGQGKPVILRPDEVIWLRYFNPLEQFAGLSPLAPQRLSVDTAQEALKHNRNIFKNGLLWGNVALVFPQTVTPDQVTEIHAALKARFAGSENSWKPAILSGGADAKNLGMTARDMEFMASLRWSLEDVARSFGIPKIMLGDLERATYSNTDAAERIFWRNTIRPLLAMLQEQVNEMLVPQFGPDLEVEFDLSDVQALQPDEDAIATRQRADIQAGVITVNEARTERGLEPVPWGDQWWASIALIPVGSTEDFVAPSEMALAKGFPDAQLDRIAAFHAKAQDVSSRSFLRLQRTLFMEQEKEVLRHLGETKGLVQKQGRFFDPAEWARRWQSRGRPVYVQVLLEAAKAEIDAFNLDIAFDIASPAPQSWLHDRIALWASLVNEETGRLITQEMAAGFEAGESIAQLETRLHSVFTVARGFRAERIARTETQGAANRGALEAYRQSEVVERKMWLATLDERTRPAHLAAHRQVVPLDQPFEVDGELVQQPGEGSPGNAINCRCSLAPVIEARRLAFGAAPGGNGHQPKEVVDTLPERIAASSKRPMRRVKQITRDENGFPLRIEETEE